MDIVWTKGTEGEDPVAAMAAAMDKLPAPFCDCGCHGTGATDPKWR